MAEEHEQELQEKRGTKYTRFQYPEMQASGVHDNMDEPPAASMFTRGMKYQKQPENRDPVVSGMMSVVNTLCQAVTSKPSLAPASSTYIKQLGELRRLFDILSPEEYEEQRSHIVSLMHELKLISHIPCILCILCNRFS